MKTQILLTGMPMSHCNWQPLVGMGISCAWRLADQKVLK